MGAPSIVIVARSPSIPSTAHDYLFPGLTALEVPSTRPERSLACTPTYASLVLTLMTVSKPSLGAEEPTGSSFSGLGPATTCQLYTSVAPFQLA
jgi:hypothetical protein